MALKRIVRIIKNWKWPDIFQQTPGGAGLWNFVQFTEEPVSNYDFLVVINNLEIDSELQRTPNKIFRIIQEPPIAHFKQWHINPPFCSKTLTCDPELSSPSYVRSQPMLPWHINRDFNFLITLPVSSKTRQLSWITTTRKFLPGHRQRMRFLHYIKGKLAALDLLGGNIKHIMNHKVKRDIEREQRELGFKYIEDKWAGLAPYKYSLAIENYSGPDYWTEKIADCFLAYTLPVYYGCTNIEDYFPERSFVRIDIEKPEQACETIMKLLKDDQWEKRIPAINEARDYILKKYQFFPAMANFIDA
jgi:hypothetical protein